MVPQPSRAAIPFLVLLVCASLAPGCARREKAPSASGQGAKRAGLHAVLPSCAFVGEPVTLKVSPLDSLGTPPAEWTGTLAISSSDPGMTDTGPFVKAEGAFRRPLLFRTPGLHRVVVTSAAGDTAVAGPVRVVGTDEELRVRPGEPAWRLFWGDAHGHSDVGDGVNPPPNYMYYGRDIAHLDFMCLSEHDFQQFLEVGLDVEEGSWERIADLAREWRRPGFAVLLGWEWSSREHGHRVVFFPDDASRYISYRRSATPAALADALRGTEALSVIAHPTGSELTPLVNWDSVVPGFDVAIEIYSGHGAMDDTDFRPTSAPQKGHSALDAMRRGLNLAFVAFSDTHLSTPGNPWPPEIRDAKYRGGMTAVWAENATERAIFEALRAGRCYATSGERVYLEFRVNDRTLGETLVAAPGETVRVQARAAAAGQVAWMELLSGDQVLERRAGPAPELTLDMAAGPFDAEVRLWVRGATREGERFWATPVRVVAP